MLLSLSIVDEKQTTMKMKCLTRVKISVLLCENESIEAVKYADIKSNRAAGWKHDVDEKRILKWQK